MQLWRVSGHNDLAGLGAEKASARWHTKEPGKRIVYCAEHPAVALLEALANLDGDPRDFPDEYGLLKIQVGADVSIETLSSESLPESWRESKQATRTIGDFWLQEGRSALLAVPSAVCPDSTNYVLNPKHPQAQKVVIESYRRLRYDKRLFHIHRD
jgi:RES domain-containing protein